jgi:hypothetical protein
MAQSQIALQASAASQVEDIPASLCAGLFPPTPALSPGICLAVAVVALRQARRVQRNGSHGPLGLWEAFAPLDAALLVAARRVLPR